jgi:osmoprotectant transport system permease protein
VVVANASRALPTLALLLIFASTPIGFGNRATVVAAAVFAVPPILTNAYTGVVGVDPDVRDSARGMGLTPTRSLLQMELPLAVPLVAAGLRTATVQVIATVPLAALVGGGGLGTIIVSGFANRRFGQVLAGAVLVTVVCLLAEGLLALAQRAVTPAGLRVARVRRVAPGTRPRVQ